MVKREGEKWVIAFCQMFRGLTLSGLIQAGWKICEVPSFEAKRISGTGNINAPDLKINSASVNISGMGSATLWVVKTLDTHISGAGSINYYGDPTLSQNNSGIGSANRLGSK